MVVVMVKFPSQHRAVGDQTCAAGCDQEGAEEDDEQCIHLLVLGGEKEAGGTS